MNKPTRLGRLQLSRSSMRLLTEDLTGVAGGRRPLFSSDPIVTSGCDPHCLGATGGTGIATHRC